MAAAKELTAAPGGLRSASGRDPESAAVPVPDFAQVSFAEITDATFFAGAQALYALTPAAAEIARRYLAAEPRATAFILAGALSAAAAATFPAERLRTIGKGAFGRVVTENWKRFSGHIFVMATGIVVRRIAPLLEHKTRDPAVVVCDEKGEFAISLLSGHIGGANRLARRLAAVLGGRAVITTATDVQGLPAIDELAVRCGCRIINPAVIKKINTLLLARRPLLLCGTRFWRERLALLLPGRPVCGEEEFSRPVAEIAGGVAIDMPDADELYPGRPFLHLESPRLVLGIGCRRGTPAYEIAEAVTAVLRESGLDRRRLAAIATAELKADESGLLEFGRRWELPFFFYHAEELAAVPVPSPSERVREVTGSPSVCEAAARLAGGGPLLVGKRKFPRVTVALGVVLGVGPG